MLLPPACVCLRKRKREKTVIARECLKCKLVLFVFSHSCDFLKCWTEFVMCCYKNVSYSLQPNQHLLISSRNLSKQNTAGSPFKNNKEIENCICVRISLARVYSSFTRQRGYGTFVLVFLNSGLIT